MTKPTNQIRVDVSGLTRNQILSKFPNISRITAWRAAKSGWLCPEFHKKAVMVASNCDHLVGYFYEVSTAAGSSTKNSGWSVRHIVTKDDAVQEGVTRLVELSAHARILDREWAIRVAKNAILQAYRRARGRGNGRLKAQRICVFLACTILNRGDLDDNATYNAFNCAIRT